MKNLVFALLFAMLLAFSAYATEEMTADGVADYAVQNVQQEGSFYFLPFPPGTRAFGNSIFGDRLRASVAQTVIRVLSEFERRKGVDVISFVTERDQNAHSAIPRLHGLFVKAVPKLPTQSSKK